MSIKTNDDTIQTIVIPVEIVVSGKKLKESPRDPKVNKQIRLRRENPFDTNKAKMDAADTLAGGEHRDKHNADNEHLIIVSVSHKDEIHWSVKKDGKMEKNWKVDVKPHDKLNASAPPPFLNIQERDDGVITSGPANPDAKGYHYEYVVTLSDGTTLDPNIFICD